MEHGHNLDYDGPAKVIKNWEQIYNHVTGNSKASGQLGGWSRSLEDMRGDSDE